MTVAAVLAMLLGAAFCLLAAVGLLRFPDIFTRAHAGSMAGLAGVGLILAGVAFASGDPNVAAAVIVLGFAACNTVEGAGKDIKSTGKAIEHTAEDAK